MKLFSATNFGFPESYYTLDDIPRCTDSNIAGSNALGYPCREFDDRGQLNLLVLGDGYCQGIGVSRDLSFSALIANALVERYGVDVANWNMGLSGKSNDYIARIILCALSPLAPDIVVILYSDIRRREYYSLAGKCVDYTPELAGAIRRRDVKASRVEMEIMRNLEHLDSAQDSYSRFIRNIALIESTLNARNTIWLGSCNANSETEVLLQALADTGRIDHRHFLKQRFVASDPIEAAGKSYPSEKDHQNFAGHVIDWLFDNHGEEMESLANQRK